MVCTRNRTPLRGGVTTPVKVTTQVETCKGPTFLNSEVWRSLGRRIAIFQAYTSTTGRARDVLLPASSPPSPSGMISSRNSRSCLSPSLPVPLGLSVSLSLSLSHTHAQSLSLSLAHCLSHTHTHSLSLSHSLSLAVSLSLSLARTPPPPPGEEATT